MQYLLIYFLSMSTIVEFSATEISGIINFIRTLFSGDVISSMQEFYKEIKFYRENT